MSTPAPAQSGTASAATTETQKPKADPDKPAEEDPSAAATATASASSTPSGLCKVLLPVSTIVLGIALILPVLSRLCNDDDEEKEEEEEDTQESQRFPAKILSNIGDLLNKGDNSDSADTKPVGNDAIDLKSPTNAMTASQSL